MNNQNNFQNYWIVFSKLPLFRLIWLWGTYCYKVLTLTNNAWLKYVKHCLNNHSPIYSRRYKLTKVKLQTICAPSLAAHTIWPNASLLIGVKSYKIISLLVTGSSGITHVDLIDTAISQRISGPALGLTHSRTHRTPARAPAGLS